ncbi:hypothetical protein SAMN05421803_10454 [Nocardiopsis flavescens]|uniref:Ig-like domain-containing protein n=1 Tax=Nocardiopsis flavescens TaxID=758803 RepID=A0A1M6H6K8_9ACTN|nr:hypothetical protein [Nocardiopsis flavescens]SHJ17804.1 hypothetical protein SAMN05421803_10454 [Nocardiopsis flavescens]
MDDDAPRTRREYAEALRELRRGLGCTPERLLRNRPLHRALARRLRARGEAPAPDRLIMALTRLIESVEDPRSRGSLLVALRLDPRYPQYSLTDRRKHYNRDLQRSPDPELHRLYVDSPRSMERRENRGIEQVAYFLSADREASVPAHLIDSPLRPIAPQRELAIEAISYLCRFSEEGVLTSQDTIRWVRAPSPDTNPELSVTHRYFNEDRSGILDLEELYGCRVVERKETVSGGLIARIRTHRHLEPEDGPFSFGVRLNTKSDVRCRPVVMWRPRTAFTKRIEFHLQFPESRSPVRSWWFQSPREIEGELEPDASEGRHLTHYDGGRYVYRIFENSDISPDLRYGISWVWP